MCHWLHAQGAVGAALFTCFVGLWCTLFLPVTPVEIISGIVFGPFTAWAVATVGQLVGAAASFLLGRYCWRDFLCGFFYEHFAFMRNMRNFLRKSPWRLAVLMRLTPLPLYVVNYGLAVLPCPTLQFFAPALCSSSVYALLWTRVGRSTRCVVSAAFGPIAEGES
ncbi:unnamed protein product, partial [Phaeothamnion confervicola]